MLLKVAPKNAIALQRLSGIILILVGFAIVLKTTRFFSRYPSWSDTVTLTVAALTLFIGSAVVLQTLRRARAAEPHAKKPRQR